MIVQNVFGRETQLGSIMDEPLKFEEQSYDKVAKVFRCLTNFYTARYIPRIAHDNVYQMWCRRIVAQGELKSAKRRASEENYRAARERGLEEASAPVFGSFEDQSQK